MLDKIKQFASEFFVTGDPLILGAQVSIGLSMIAMIFVLTLFQKVGMALA